MKLTKNWILQEFVPQHIYKQYGDSAIQFIDSRLPNASQVLRDVMHKELVDNKLYFDLKMEINTWHSGGDRDESGYRDPDSKTGAKRSAHKRGCAIDFNVFVKRADGAWELLPSLKVQEIIKKTHVWRQLSTFWTTMEDSTVGWTHLDMRFRDKSDYIMGPFLIPIPK